MVAITYGGARVAAPAVAGTKPAKKGKSFLARMFDAVADAQMKRAERELALHRHLLPHDFVLQRSLWSRNDDQEPFGGW
jgi:high-affinity K+ transport system ATPase subunit B